MVCIMSFVTNTAAASKLGGPKFPVALLLNPYCSFGTPKKLVSRLLFAFTSWNTPMAYWPAGMSKTCTNFPACVSRGLGHPRSRLLDRLSHHDLVQMLPWSHKSRCVVHLLHLCSQRLSLGCGISSSLTTVTTPTPTSDFERSSSIPCPPV